MLCRHFWDHIQITHFGLSMYCSQQQNNLLSFSSQTRQKMFMNWNVVFVNLQNNFFYTISASRSGGTIVQFAIGPQWHDVLKATLVIKWVSQSVSDSVCGVSWHLKIMCILEFFTKTISAKTNFFRELESIQRWQYD